MLLSKVISLALLLVIGLYAISAISNTGGASPVRAKQVVPVSNIAPSGVYSRDGWSWSG